MAKQARVFTESEKKLILTLYCGGLGVIPLAQVLGLCLEKTYQTLKDWQVFVSVRGISPLILEKVKEQLQLGHDLARTSIALGLSVEQTRRYIVFIEKKIEHAIIWNYLTENLNCYELAVNHGSTPAKVCHIIQQVGFSLLPEPKLSPAERKRIASLLKLGKTTAEIAKLSLRSPLEIERFCQTKNLRVATGCDTKTKLRLVA